MEDHETTGNGDELGENIDDDDADGLNPSEELLMDRGPNKRAERDASLVRIE